MHAHKIPSADPEHWPDLVAFVSHTLQVKQADPAALRSPKKPLLHVHDPLADDPGCELLPLGHGAHANIDSDLYVPGGQMLQLRPSPT